ncbi:outer membrane protein assembly factor BamB family protein [Halopiger djelfimassiliensis]|uniref:outer membrane protein assembly factor BamB family protein n=1 Tax=Halopiger djelfimassiliensis TaxID=1293047 RepID=UPI000677DBDE|nr:PQQ-binding-like beta-propeller repeat protein [Halopiger djelfimassiliensis]
MTDWNQYKGDARNSGCRRDLEGPARVTETWSADLVGSPGSPVFDRDSVYVGTDRGNCYALERETGRRRWVVETTAATDATPIVSGDRLYLGTDEGTVYALDTATGEQRWHVELPAEFTAAGLAFSNDCLYVGHADGLIALETETGTELWSHETESAVVDRPAIADGREQVRGRDPIDTQQEPTHLGSTRLEDRDADHRWRSERVFVGTDYGSVRALEAETGEEAWSAPTDGTVAAGPTVAEGRVYVADDDGTMLALDGGTGQTWFTYEIRGGFTTSPTVLAAAETTFVGATDGYCHVTDTTVGKRKLRGWLFSRKGIELDGPVRSCPVVVGNVLCVGDASGSLYGIDADEPDLLWYASLEAAVVSTPAVAPGRLYVGSEDGTLHCLAWDDDPSR